MYPTFDSFNKQPKMTGLKVMRYFIFIAIGLSFLGFIAMASMGVSGYEGKPTGKLYMIRAYDGMNENTFMADSIISQTERCVKFIDAFRMEQSICGENIVITKMLDVSKRKK